MKMNCARAGHTATILQDGTVLLVGGVNSIGSLASAEIYNSGSLSLCSPMAQSRYGHTATLFTDGTVLVAGGSGTKDGWAWKIASTEFFYSPSKSFQPGPMMTVKRCHHTATLMEGGWVLLAGGVDGVTGALKTADLYDPTTKTFATIPSPMRSERSGHTATLLKDGTVLISGGMSQSSIRGTNTAEIYSPRSGVFSAVGSMAQARCYHTATLLTDGSVLIAGGEDDGHGTAEIYDPGAHSFMPLGPLGAMIQYRVYHTATLLTDGNVLFLGSPQCYGAEVYLSKKKHFAPTVPAYSTCGDQTATLLPSGDVLVAGGRAGEILDVAELWEKPPSLEELKPPLPSSLRDRFRIPPGLHDLLRPQ